MLHLQDVVAHVLIRDVLNMINDDRIRGVLFGLAAGDMIGGPIRLALQLSRSLIRQQEFDADDVLRLYVNWWQTEGFDTGPIAHQVFKRIQQGIPYSTATYQVHKMMNGLTAGCNPAHRSVPLALAGIISDDQLPEVAHAEAKLTHWDTIAGDVSEVSLMLCRLLIQGREWSDAVNETLPLSTIEKITDAHYKTLLSRGGFAPDVLLTALYFVMQHASFDEALASAIAFAGPANYCPVLVGAIAGARWGKEAISDSKLGHCQQIQPDILEVIEGFVNTWSAVQ